MKYIDISEHQGIIDFDALKGNASGVMIRAGYGQNNIDKYFARNISECNRLGIPCGVYWFSYAYTAGMAKAEAEYCLAAIEPYRVELPVAFDFEYDSVNHAAKKGVLIVPSLANSMVKAFCGAVEAAGYYAMNYANPDFLTRYMTDVAAYDLWLAAWPNSVDLAKPPRKCGIWQWGGSAVPGINGNVDTDEAYNDYAKIIREAGLNNLQPKHWYDEAMAWTKENCIMDGTRPEDTVTRAEAAQMFFNYAMKNYKNVMLTDD